ncbi:FMRFamide receptor-like [Physella acuta]|uniref:FMRFamide receptor-like n=1 Tax=Physella acuta TaxID=109671 RepID=UPI0027DAE67C|nr:FMRFamide receptor-like [Physella acuta]XP_059148701.1 FMRFamide receptor-like [Physella acuta]
MGKNTSTGFFYPESTLEVYAAPSNISMSTPYSALTNMTLSANESLSPACNSSGENSLSAINFYLTGIGALVLVILGAVGNTLAMIVLTRRTMRTSTNVFLTALAIWDTVVLAVVLPLMSLPVLSEQFNKHVTPYIVVSVYPIGLAAQTATVWLTVSFTVERYIAVCHPLRAASMCTIPRARMVVLVISIVSILYNVPRWFEYTSLELTDQYNQICLAIIKTQLGSEPIYHKLYFGWLYFLVMCFIPLCSLAILNAFLIVAVRRSKKQRRDMNVRQSRENNVTIMLVSVVIVFIICQVPALIYNMAYAIDTAKVESSAGWIVLSSFRNFLVMLNSAVNFILYCALGQKFRRTFVRTLCPCLVRRMPGRFQSFSFHHNIDSHHAKTAHNGNVYAKVGYQQCRTDVQSEHEVGLDMAVLKAAYSPRESTDSNGSAEVNDVFVPNNSQRSHLKLLSPISKGGRAS